MNVNELFEELSKLKDIGEGECEVSIVVSEPKINEEGLIETSKFVQKHYQKTVGNVKGYLTLHFTNG